MASSRNRSSRRFAITVRLPEGQRNDIEVLGRLLGVDPERLDRLAQASVLVERPVSPDG